MSELDYNNSYKAYRGRNIMTGETIGESDLEHQLRLIEIEERFEKKRKISKVVGEIVCFGACYLAASGADSIIAEVPFTEALSHPFTYAKAGMACAYAVKMMSWAQNLNTNHDIFKSNF